MRSDDRGSVTIEAAIALSALIVVGGLLMGALVTVANYIAAIDAAGAAARAHAIGTTYTPPRGVIDIAESGSLVTATAQIPSPLGHMHAQAVYPREYQSNATQLTGMQPTGPQFTGVPE